jgi:hypothetical protein
VPPRRPLGVSSRTVSLPIQVTFCLLRRSEAPLPANCSRFLLWWRGIRASPLAQQALPGTPQRQARSWSATLPDLYTGTGPPLPGGCFCCVAACVKDGVAISTVSDCSSRLLCRFVDRHNAPLCMTAGPSPKEYQGHIGPPPAMAEMSLVHYHGIMSGKTVNREHLSEALHQHRPIAHRKRGTH